MNISASSMIITLINFSRRGTNIHMTYFIMPRKYITFPKLRVLEDVEKPFNSGSMQ